MFNFITDSKQKFSRLKKPLQHEIEVLAVFLALFIIIVPLVGVFNAKEGERKASNVIFNYPATLNGFNGIAVVGNVPFVEPNNYNYRVNLRFTPYGNYSQGDLGKISVPIMVKINGRKSDVVEAGDVIPPQDLTFTFTSGSATEYPFEEYTDILMIVATAFIGNETLNIPIAFEYSTFLQGWDLTSDILSPDLANYLESETQFRRSKTTKFFSVFINILMWLLSLFLLAITVGIWFRKRKVEAPLLAFNAALLFAIPAIRQVQPGVPTIGCIADAVGFFWCMAIVSACLLALMLNYTVKYQADVPSKKHLKTLSVTETPNANDLIVPVHEAQ